MSKSWFITGCSTGFGRLLAKYVLERGDCVCATARNLRDIEGLSGADDRLLRLPLDVTRNAQFGPAAVKAIEKFGRIDVLVNNAGYGYFALQEDGDIDEIRRMFETNVFGPIRLTQAFLPHMRRRGGGTIVNLSSVGGRVAFARSGFYSASKFGLEALSEALYHEAGPLGVRVIVIEPGAYATDFSPRSAVRSPGLDDPKSPYSGLFAKWTAAAGKMMPARQDPIEVVEAIVQAVDGGQAFVRIPVGRDALALTQERTSMSDADFMSRMARRYAEP